MAQVELSFCTSYVDPEGEHFHKGRIYEIPDADVPYYLQQTDERGLSIFRVYAPPPPPPEEEVSGIVKKTRPLRPGRPARDTGAMNLDGGGSKSTKRGVTIVKQSPNEEIDTGASSSGDDPARVDA